MFLPTQSKSNKRPLLRFRKFWGCRKKT